MTKPLILSSVVYLVKSDGVGRTESSCLLLPEAPTCLLRYLKHQGTDTKLQALVVPPSDLRPPPGIKSEAQEEEEQENLLLYVPLYPR